jgi:hypothetical protein
MRVLRVPWREHPRRCCKTGRWLAHINRALSLCPECQQMVEIVEIGDFVGIGANRPFLGRDSTGGYWAVKSEGICDSLRHLCWDYVGSQLALWLGLPWVSPVRIGFLGQAATEQFNRIFETHLRVGSLCLLTGYNQNLRVLDYGNEYPFQYGCSNGPFMLMPEAERRSQVQEFLAPHIEDASNLSTIYGRVVFDNWVMERRPFMDMLQLDESTGRLVCLDASTCFHPRQETIGEFRRWSSSKTEIHCDVPASVL